MSNSNDTTPEPMVEAPYEPMRVWTDIPPGLEHDREQVAIYVIERLRETLSLNDSQWRRVMSYHHDKASSIREFNITSPRQFSGPAYPATSPRADSHMRSLRTERAVSEPYPPDDTEPA